MGERVRTLTGHPHRQNPFGDRVSAAPFNFDNPDELTRSLGGASTLYNTYWVRFPYGDLTFERAVENTSILIRAAGEAGVRRIVHLSITGASEDSHLPYFRGKGLAEKAVIRSGLSYAIIRPSVIFGAEDILINNLAWLLRRFPLFAVPGSGEYRLQPVFVEDVAEIAVSAANHDHNLGLDAVGPEAYTFNELVLLVGGAVRSRARIVHVAPSVAVILARLVGCLVNDVVLTHDEVAGLMESLLVSGGPPLGHTSLGRWLEQNADWVGVRYASELNRHYRER
jgi:NADH dehydrogenase